MSHKFKTAVNIALSTNPATGSVGDLYYDTTSNSFKYYTGSTWNGISGPKSTYSTTPPSTPNAGDYWINSNTGIGYVYISDANSSQWVDIESNGFVGPSGSLTVQDITTNSPAYYPVFASSTSSGGTGIATVYTTSTKFSVNPSTGAIVAGSFSVGGTSNQFLKADGSLDSNTYLTAANSTYVGTTLISLNRSSASQTLTGISIDGNAGTVTNGIYTSSTIYLGTTAIPLNRASGAQTLSGISIDGNSGTVTNGVYTTGTYSDPSWITGLGWSKISSTPTTLAGYGITDGITSATAAATYLPLTGGTLSSDLTVTGNLTVNGTTTTINSATISVDDKNIELGSITTPTDTTADGGGITLKGTTDKTLNWVNATGSWTSSENIDLASGKVIKIAGTQILSPTQYVGNAATVTNGVYTNTNNTLSGILNVTGGDTSNSSIQVAGYNQHGGTGYHGFLKITNTYGSATNPNKSFRINSSGQIEILNSAYTSVILSLTDAGALTVPSTITASSIIKSGGTSNQYLMADGSTTTGSATTAMNYAQTQATKQSGISASGVTIVSVSITTGGNPVQVLVTGDGENTAAGGWVKVQLFRGTTAIGKIVHLESSAASENVPYALTVIDTPAAGTYTYSLQTVSAVSTGSFNFGETDGPVLTAIELNTLTPTVNLNLTGTVAADQISATNNGNGTNFKVGDDAWIGDINISNTMSIKGQQSSSAGYIRFGSDTNGIGFNGTNLVYGTTVIPSSGGTLITSASPTFTGTVTLPTSTSSSASLILPAGTVLTTPLAGAIEFDGSTPYFTNSTTSGRNLLETAIFMTNGIYTVPLKNSTAAQPLFGAFVSATGTLGTPTGTGPWTVVVTGLSNTGGFRPGTTITATAGTGSFNTNTVTITSVDSATQITVSATGGTIPTAGTVTNITSTTTGAVTLPANTAYMLEAWFPGIANASSSTKTFSVTGTATYSAFVWETISSTTTAGGTTVNAGTVWNNTTSIVSNSTASSTTTSVLLKGYFKTNASGTFIPNLTFSVGGASTMNGGSYIKLTPVGTGSAFGLGAWA